MRVREIIFVTAAIMMATGAVFAAVESKKPNILFVLVDDQRNTSLGCAGHPQIQTPTIDALAENGVRFENAFVQMPICMSSRATIFTGLTATTHRFVGHKAPSKPIGRNDVETSFPTLLRQAGYATGFFGKQHVWFSCDGMGMMFDEYKKMTLSPYLKKMPDGSLRHTDEIMGDKSVGFIKKQSADKPFFLYMSFNISHARDSDRRPGYHYQWAKEEDGLYEDLEPDRPLLEDDKYFDSLPEFIRKSLNNQRYYWRWDTEEKYRINMRAYYRMLKGMDRIVGRAITALKEKGLDDNTVIIYSADNGYFMGDRGLAGKWSHFEQSLRVPLIVYDPRAPESKRGKVVNQTAVNLDIPCTILDKAGIDIPKKYQGRSLTPLLEGEKPADWRTDFYCEHQAFHKSIPKWYGVRNERYTYANYYEKNVELLYDRQRDPTQLTNVADNPEYAGILKELRNESNDYRQRYSRKSERIEEAAEE